MPAPDTPVLAALREPIVLAPLAGGPSTPELAAAVSEAGGLGFLAAGYLATERLAQDIERLGALGRAPFGVNLFLPAAAPADPRAVTAYARTLQGEAERLGAELGTARGGDDEIESKLALLEDVAPAVVSFTFGCPPAAAVAALRERGSEVWVTVTSPAQAREALEARADAAVVQGAEAGGHRGGFGDGEDAGLGLLALLRLVRRELPELALVATGGIGDGAAVAAALAAGAAAAALGSAFLRCPEAGTTPAHRAALAEGRPTALTRAFTGRAARGLRNRFMDEHGAEAPVAYPDVHHLTAPLRAAGRARGDAEVLNLWAGQAHGLAREEPAGQTVARLARECRNALAEASARWSLPPGAPGSS